LSKQVLDFSEERDSDKSSLLPLLASNELESKKDYQNYPEEFITKIQNPSH
jgi:hypothetical protein